MSTNKRPVLPCFAWVLLALALLGIPLLLMRLGSPPAGRSFAIEFAVALGFLALGLFCLQFFTTARFPRVGKPFGSDVLLIFHRQMGLIALVFVLGHALILMAADPAYRKFLDPRENLPRAAALSMVLAALGALTLTSVWRRFWKLSYEQWRLVHAGLAGFIVLVGLAHTFMVGHFTASPWKKLPWLLLALAAFASLAHVRLYRPWHARRHPWQLASVSREATGTWTVELKAQNHDGLHFEAGQYAWLSFNPSWWNLQQHPFSMASSATDPQRLRFTIKELGDFTGTISRFAPGTPVAVEGPYGRFTLRSQAPGTVFIAGGIGITPALSLLRTLQARGVSHPFLLIYAASTEDKLVFRQELDTLAAQGRVKVVYVLEAPPPDWGGESGRIHLDLLDKHLPHTDRHLWDYMLCGPDPMILSVHQALCALRIPKSRQRAERFQMV